MEKSIANKNEIKQEFQVLNQNGKRNEQITNLQRMRVTLKKYYFNSFKTS